MGQAAEAVCCSSAAAPEHGADGAAAVKHTEGLITSLPRLSVCAGRTDRGLAEVAGPTCYSLPTSIAALLISIAGGASRRKEDLWALFRKRYSAQCALRASGGNI